MSAGENPPAFPQAGGRLTDPTPGMSLRDYFAGHALAGYTANRELQIAAARVARDQGRSVQAEIAEACYGFADAMLAARNPGDPQ